MNPFRQTRLRNGRVALALVAALASALAMPRAYAQGASPNVVIAENLFREGQALLEQAKTDDSKTHLACEKFAESEQLRPALGTLLNLAVCHEKEKKTASAWAEYTEVAGQASRAGQADRAQFASQHAAALESQLCHVRLEMASVPRSVEVKIDGQPLGAAVLGADIPLDPGAHTVVVSAPSKQAWTHDFTLAPGQPTDHETVSPLLDEVAVAPAAPAQTTSRGPVGYVVGGVGVAAIAVGGILIGRSAAYGSQSDDESAKAKTFSIILQRGHLRPQRGEDEPHHRRRRWGRGDHRRGGGALLLAGGAREGDVAQGRRAALHAESRARSHRSERRV
jgi:hypothetical protein